METNNIFGFQDRLFTYYQNGQGDLIEYSSRPWLLKVSILLNQD
jgi:hypothetical protein